MFVIGLLLLYLILHLLSLCCHIYFEYSSYSACYTILSPKISVVSSAVAIKAVNYYPLLLVAQFLHTHIFLCPRRQAIVQDEVDKQEGITSSAAVNCGVFSSTM